ncbi:hypothetical protein BTIS_0176 [Bifidobacterium tissieri]|uniref:Uncharacterized protein n=1 Tax=Bifidobacterium tissieri TaxID=1630162 RepID=A0A261FJ64_9BIFI|nr:hypothetical protein [Bifidobacterium tissieri]OZG59023.1 hypothetical protein BTIS_0176 [Bifidobacterium tissieri]
MNGIEIKTLRDTSSKNTIDTHLKKTSNKLDAKRVVIDNVDNKGMSDEELIRCIKRSRRFKDGMVYIIGKDGQLRRIR